MNDQKNNNVTDKTPKIIQNVVASKRIDVVYRKKEHDGRTEHVRIWTLGDMNKVFPTEAAFKALKTLLQSWDGVSSIDIIWPPGLKMEEYALGKCSKDIIKEQSSE